MIMQAGVAVQDTGSAYFMQRARFEILFVFEWRLDGIAGADIAGAFALHGAFKRISGVHLNDGWN